MLRFNKKGADISITVIIVAAVSLIVLVVLIAIFTGRIGVFSQKIDEQGKNICQNQGGRCITGACDSTLEVRAFGARCVDGSDQPIPGQICCVPRG